MKEVSSFLSELDNMAKNQYQDDMNVYKVKLKITEFAIKQAESKAKEYIKNGDFKAAEAILLDDSEDPKRPGCFRYVVNDTSVEQLGVVLAENPQGLMLIRDELNGWLTGLNKYDGQKDRAFWLEAFNGDGDFRYDRISRESILIPSNTISLLGGIQPSKLIPLLLAQKNGTGDDGMVERFQLMVYPDPEKFIYTDRKPNNEEKEKAHQAFSKLNAIKYK